MIFIQPLNKFNCLFTLYLICLSFFTLVIRELIAGNKLIEPWIYNFMTAAVNSLDFWFIYLIKFTISEIFRWHFSRLVDFYKICNKFRII